jgi:hypothetical protein
MLVDTGLATRLASFGHGALGELISVSNPVDPDIGLAVGFAYTEQRI